MGTFIGVAFACIMLGVSWWAIQQLLAPGKPFVATLTRDVLPTVLFVLIVLYGISILLGAAGIHVHVPSFLTFGAPP